MIKSLYVVAFAFLQVIVCEGQNIGIGKVASRGPLGFEPLLGQKITLWDDGNVSGGNYGLGIQSGLMQIHAYTSIDNIAIGTGKSTSFIENFRFTSSGKLGIGNSDPIAALDINGRLRLGFDGTPGITPGFWLNASNNSNFTGFVGIANYTNTPPVGFYGANYGWGFTFNPYYGAIGIQNPDAVSSTINFANILGKKISFYPGATGDVGIGVANNRLQIYSDHPGTDVAFGKSVNGIFTERFAVKATGAIALNGNTGQPGQFLVSGGYGVPATWQPLAYWLPEKIVNTQRIYISDINITPTYIPGLSKQYVLSYATKVLVDVAIEVESIACGLCGPSGIEIWIDDRTDNQRVVLKDVVENGKRIYVQGRALLDGNIGTNYVDIIVKRTSGPAIYAGSSNFTTNPNFMIFEPLE